MNREQLLIVLRQLYKERDFDNLRKKYLLGAWLLTNEDREKIERVLNVQYKPTTPEQQKLIDYCVEELGWKLIHDK